MDEQQREGPAEHGQHHSEFKIQMNDRAVAMHHPLDALWRPSLSLASLFAVKPVSHCHLNNSRPVARFQLCLLGASHLRHAWHIKS